jgi:RNA polymerase sigma-70 factor (ECF subfamily)
LTDVRTQIQALYEEHAGAVHRFALYLSGNHSEADDITSETFVRAWTAPNEVMLETVKGYLFAIARNLYRQRLRKTIRQTSFSDETSGWTGEMLPTQEAGPYQQVAGKEELELVIADLQTLPEIDRAALLMRASDEMSYEEIARALNLSLSATKVKIHRARLALDTSRKRRR